MAAKDGERFPRASHPSHIEARRREVYQACLGHMVMAAERAAASDDPFPHFLISGVFPADVYDELLAHLPEPALYKAFSYKKHATDEGGSNRGNLTLSEANLDRMPDRSRGLWLGVRDALGAPRFKDAVFRRLAPGLAYRMGVSDDEAARMPGYPMPQLFRETAGYTIAPHPDTRRKLVTMQVALPGDDSQRDLGTEFYRRSWNPMTQFREPRGFEIAKQPPFLPNSAYAFAVINTLRLKSWHGRSKLTGESGVRNSILNIWYAQPQDASADLVEQFYQKAA
jgi:hypothetical protein